MQRTRSLPVILAAMISCMAHAQTAAPPALYLAVDCMKSSSAGYVQMELETWKPVHQYLVDRGKRCLLYTSDAADDQGLV